MKKILSIVFSVIMCIQFSACNENKEGSDTSANTANGITLFLDVEELVLEEGESSVITAILSEEAELVWDSSDRSVATVEDGFVVALKEGETIITAIITDGTVYATCKVTVTERVYTYDPEDIPVIAASAESGFYLNEFDLKLETNRPDCTVYYTIDGSDPLSSDTKTVYSDKIRVYDRTKDKNVLSAIEPSTISTFSFNNPHAVPTVKVDKCFALKAVAVTENGLVSERIDRTYFVGDIAKFYMDAQNFMIVSLTSDAYNLFDYEYGIYVNGKTYDEVGNPADGGWAMANYRNKGREWERTAHAEFLENDGSTALSMDCGIRIQGGYSRGDVLKSFRLYARKDYTPETSKFKYNFFEGLKSEYNGKKIDKFKKLVLRTGSNEAFSLKFQDHLQQKMVKGGNYSVQEGRPCLVYLDGEFWGYYILQEDFSKEYFEDHYGVGEDDVVMIKSDVLRDGVPVTAKAEEGTDEDLAEYFEMNEWFKTADLTKQTDYNKACEYFDVESLSEYLAFQAYISNCDWPYKNWAFWKSRKIDSSNPYADGKWRLCIYDTELGGDSINASASWGRGIYGARDNVLNNYVNQYNARNPERSDHMILFIYKFYKNSSFKNLLKESLREMAGYLSSSQWSEQAAAYKAIYTEADMNKFFKRYPCVGASYNGSFIATYNRVMNFYSNRESYVLNTMINSI